MRWKCAKGHEWNATLESVKNRDSWCSMCVGRNQNIEDMQNLAQKRLSDSYKDAHSKLVWSCSKGYIWNATFANVKYHGS